MIIALFILVAVVLFMQVYIVALHVQLHSVLDAMYAVLKAGR